MSRMENSASTRQAFLALDIDLLESNKHLERKDFYCLRLQRQQSSMVRREYD